MEEIIQKGKEVCRDGSQYCWLRKKVSTPAGCLIIILVISLCGGILVWQYQRSSAGAISPPSIEVPKEVNVSEVDHFETYSEIKLTRMENTYLLGSFEFEIIHKESAASIYPSDRDFLVVKKVGEEIYNEEIVTFDDISAFEYRGYRYIVVNSLSGGMHCCEVDDIFVIGGDDQLGFIGRAYGSYSSLSRELTEDNGKLYFIMNNDSFHCDFGCMAECFYVDVFREHYLIDGDRLILSNHDFEDEYYQEAQQNNEDLERCYNGDVAEGWECTPYLWRSYLAMKTVNLLLADEDDKAWETFRDDFLRFNQRFPIVGSDGGSFGPTNSEELRREIESEVEAIRKLEGDVGIHD